VSAQALFAEVSDLAWYEQLMRTNHWGGVWCTHAVLEPLKASRGRIVAGRSGLDERGAMSMEECARPIVEGTEARQREIVMTAKGKLGRWLKLIAPRIVDRLALAALKQEVRPR
jgi:NAD(P)-dependent dehydrogenase (short-subunit alcohol dehydrogenase family)